MNELNIFKEKYFQERQANKGLLGEIIFAVEAILKKHQLDNIEYKKIEAELNFYYFKMIASILSSEKIVGNNPLKNINEEKNAIKNELSIKRFLTNEYSDNRVIEELKNIIYRHNIDKLLGITDFRSTLKKELEQALLPIFNADIDELLDIVFYIKSEMGMGKRISLSRPGAVAMEEVII
jgi:hypothetical protein